MSNRKGENISNEDDAIKHKRSNDETEDDRTSANKKKLSTEIKDEKEESLWLYNNEVQWIMNQNYLLLHRLEEAKEYEDIL